MTPAQMAKRIESWPIARLIPYAKNPRMHSPEQIDKIARSIETFGFTNPILVDENDGILAGHGRLAAAQKLGLVQVPVVPLDNLSEDQKRLYIIADNRIALDAGWDPQLLAGELAELAQEDIDLTLTGFEEDEIEDLIAGADGEAPDQSSPSETKIGVFVNCSGPRQQKKVIALLAENGFNDCRAVN